MCKRKYPQKQVIKGNIKGPWAISAQTRKILVQPDTDHSLQFTDFLTASSSNIEDALLSEKKRNVNVEKFIQKRGKRVKQLNDKQLKPVTVLTKTTDLPAYGSSPWPTYPYAGSKTSQYQGPPSNSELAVADLGSLPSEFLMVHLQYIQLLTATTRSSILNWIVQQASEASSYRSQSAVESQVYLTERLYSSPIFASTTLMTSSMISHLIILTGQSPKKILTHIIRNPLMVSLQDHNMHGWNIRIKLLQAWFHHTFLFQIQT